MLTMRKFLPLLLSVTPAQFSPAQTLKSYYIDWGTQSENFHNTLLQWSPGSKVSDDDNFFISRVKPKERFRNTATQVRAELRDENDKHLIAWMPCNNSDYNALPDGAFDNEVFSMWPYVTHWGNWSCPLGRVPGAFLDVAHKNGVPVSSVADIPAGTLTDEYAALLDSIVLTDIDNDAMFFNYYGVDGLGYNSEFQTTSSRVRALQTFHGGLVEAMREDNPLFENIWYDGTSYYGKVNYDLGLDSHNSKNFGDGDEIRTSLFLNYNWNDNDLLSSSQAYAISMGRDPLDLYCGFNLQGGEPSGESWPLLAGYNLSIGLWGAHGENMFWESRHEKGAAEDVKQHTYRQRIERWFTGGTRNPANCPEIKSSLNYNADNYSFCGMSSFMTAHSSLCWDLAEEPFISFFNLGNGTFFNINGVRASDEEWYNIGLQDYLPTWRWWFATRLLGGSSANVPATGLEADFTYGDAYFGGSALCVAGTTAEEYLHLFKTEFELCAGDIITLKYKVTAGTASINLVLTAKDAETDAVEYDVMSAGEDADADEWVERTFTIDDDFGGKVLALVALHFTDASSLRLLLGEFSITRGVAACPEKPEIEKASILHNCMDGIDGKLIFNMPNDKGEGEPCYNTDVNTSHFRLYAQCEDGDETFIGATTSWAGLLFRIPYTAGGGVKVRLGVSAVSLDTRQESEIAWSEYMEPSGYVYDDGIQKDKSVIKPQEDFTLSYNDPLHEDGTWTLVNSRGDTVFTAAGHDVTVEGGLPAAGNYDLLLNGYVYEDGDSSARILSDSTYKYFVQVTDASTGALPEIYTLTANGADADISVIAGESVSMAYTGRYADGRGSRGVKLDERRFGVPAEDVDVTGANSFTVSFWIKINLLRTAQPTQLFSVADKLDDWPKTDYGWFCFDLGSDGAIDTYTFRGTDEMSDPELRYVFENTVIPVGNWTHIAMVFEYDGDGLFRSQLYVNGEKQEVTRWMRSTDDGYTDGEPGFEPDVYNITSGQMLAAGGDAYGRDGIDGVIDNFEVWNKALSAEEVAAAMGDIPRDTVPDGLAAAWDMEEDAGEDSCFASVNGTCEARAGLHYYVKSGSEGQGTLAWLMPEYSLGSPFLSGEAYKVETSPGWSGKKATVTDEEGDSQQGSATLTYGSEGDYDITLTLANDLGEDARTFSSISVSTTTDITEEATGNMPRTYLSDGTAYIHICSPGDYTAELYASDGKMAASRQASVSSQSVMQIEIHTPGVYLLTVKKNGNILRTVKMVSK